MRAAGMVKAAQTAVVRAALAVRVALMAVAMVVAGRARGDAARRLAAPRG